MADIVASPLSDHSVQQSPVPAHSPPPASPSATDPDETLEQIDPGNTADAEDAEIVDDGEEEEAEEDDEGIDDPDEPKYCYCNRGSYGEMIACDNEQCPKEWFHLGCTGLKEPPDEEEKWYCDECAPIFLGAARGSRGRGRGRGRG
jgi:hypothetical protein